MEPGSAQQYYECICQWLQSHEGAMQQLIDQLRGSNDAVCTQTECFASGTTPALSSLRARTEIDRERKALFLYPCIGVCIQTIRD
jgi:hypothetical protein